MTNDSGSCSSDSGTSCSSSKCKVWCYLYGLLHLLLMTCIATSLWEIYWAITALAPAESG